MMLQKTTQVGAIQRARIEDFYRGQRIAYLPVMGREGLIL